VCVCVCVCEQLARGRYVEVERPWVEFPTSRLFTTETNRTISDYGGSGVVLGDTARLAKHPERLTR